MPKLRSRRSATANGGVVAKQKIVQKAICDDCNRGVEERFKEGIKHATDKEREKSACAAAIHRTQMEVMMKFSDKKHKEVCDTYTASITGLKKELAELRASTCLPCGKKFKKIKKYAMQEFQRGKHAMCVTQKKKTTSEHQRGVCARVLATSCM